MINCTILKYTNWFKNATEEIAQIQLNNLPSHGDIIHLHYKKYKVIYNHFLVVSRENETGSITGEECTSLGIIVKEINY